MNIRFVLLCAVVISSQGILSDGNVASITNDQNKPEQALKANFNAETLDNPATTGTSPQQSLILQKQYQNKIHYARGQQPRTKNLKQKPLIYTLNNGVPNKQSVMSISDENKYFERFNQNFHNLNRNVNNFPLNGIANNVDLPRNEHSFKATFDTRNLLHNSDIGHDDTSTSINETSTNIAKQPVSTAVHKNRKVVETVMPMPNQDNNPLLGTLSNKDRYFQQPHKHYILRRKNGNLEYYDDLETILRKYPYITIPDNILHLTPNRPTAEHDTSLPEKVIKPIHTMGVNSFDLVSNTTTFDTKPKEFKKQFTNTQAQNVTPLQEKFKINNESSYEIQNNYEKPNNFQETKLGLKDNQASYTPLKRVFDQPEKAQRPILDANTFSKTVQNSRNESKITQKNKIVSLTDKTITNEKVNIANATNITGISNLSEDVLLKPNNLNKSHHDNLTHQHDLNKEQAVNINKLVQKFWNVTYAQEGKLNDSQTIEITSPVVENEIYEEHSLNTSNESTTTEKNAVLSNNSSFKNQGAFDGQAHKILANVNNLEKDKPVINTQKEKFFEDTTEDFKGEDYDQEYFAVGKPTMWVKTTDPHFWKKLVDNDDSVVYIINVQSQPKVEKDRKTTIYANGTIVEEIIETVWEYGNKKVKVTKTIKVIPGKDIE